MHEGTGAELSVEGLRRVLARLRGRAAERDEALAAALPALGTTVGGFVLEAFLGEGGYGTVYLARRGGRLFAVKFLYLPQVGPWARREVEVMLRLEEVGGVGLEGHGFWPDEERHFVFIAMEYVPGEEAYAWARHHNPHALEVVDLLLALAKDLAVVHSVGVVHRDVKGDNILVREADGAPVLVDFGVATYAGAPRVTGPEVPGCREYLAPEAVRFNRESDPQARYPARALDDLWALGVLAYKLLTATYPFRGHNALELEKAILHEAPEPPHLRNPRVPRAVSELCLKLLEKEPGARYPDADALVAALEEARRGADEPWKVPLCEAWGPDAATTRRSGALSAGGRLARLNRLVEYEQRHPRRGVPRTRAPPRPLERTGPSPRRRAGRGVRVLLLGLTATWLCTGDSRPLSSRARLSEPVTPALTLRVASLLVTGKVMCGGQEVAPSGWPLEGGADAVPLWASTSASVARATFLQDLLMKTRTRMTKAVVGAALTCTLASGCPSPTSRQVRPRPPPAACPDGSLEAMEKLGAYGRDWIDPDPLIVTLTPVQNASIINVRDGEVVVTLGDDSGRLVAGSTLRGRLIIGETRVYGRFTWARLPNGEEYPVCFQFMAREMPRDPLLPGAVVKDPSASPNLARIFSTQFVVPVERLD